MRRASSYFWRVLPLIVIVFSFAAILLSGEEANKTPLEALLSGTSRDAASVLSSIEERDLPLALAASEILKFRAVHGDILFTPKEAEDFHSAVTTRLQNAGTVSLKKTETCPTAVPERVVELAGQKITIPPHFIANQALIILDSEPKDEAGTLLPDLQVFYRSAQPLSKYVFTLDGKPLNSLTVSRETLSYRPPVSLTNILAIGTHTAEVRLWDAAGHEASKKWSFTVGLKPVPCSSIPTNAAKIGSFTTTIESLFPDSTIKGTLLIRVFESAEGKRYFEYSVFDPKRGVREMMTTSNLYSLRKFLRTGGKRDTLRIDPQIQYCFPGTTFTFSTVFSGDDNATIKSLHWNVIRPGGEIVSSCDEPTITWTVTEEVEFEVSMVVEYKSTDGSTYTQTYWANVMPHFFTFNSNLGFAFPNFMLSDTGDESVPITATRQIMDVGPDGYYFRDLIEGQTIPFPSGWDDHGAITVVRSRVKIIAGDGKVEIENPTAGQAKLLFKKYGYVEYVNDISLTYDYKNQHDSKDLPCSDSALFGVYPYKAVAKFEKIPPGIIRDTSRLFHLKQVDISINGIPGKATTQDGISCPITPPIQLAKSAMFPQTRPIVADSLFPIFVRKEANGLSQLPQVENLKTTLAYDDDTYVEHGGIPCRAYFFAYSTMGTKREPIDWDLFNRYARPMSNWFSVEAFPNPADLVTLGMTPPSASIFEGQAAKIPVTILPLPGKGTGQITNDGGQINLLDGYETQRLEDFSWTARILSPVQPKGKPRTENLEINFKPEQGAGNYEIEASATLTVKENETGSVGKVTGKNTTRVPVQPITATLKSIEFLSDHNLLKKNPTSGSVWGDSNNDYETPEWVAGVRSNPISHTKNTKITATVKVKIEPPGIHFDLIGDGPDDYVTFEKTSLISIGDEQDITVTANANLPDQIGILNKDIQWKIRIEGVERYISSSIHKIYVTFGIPEGSIVTERRIQEVCLLASGKSSLEDCALASFNGLHGAFRLDSPMWGPSPIWLLHDPALGEESQCPGLADYVNKHFQMLGLGAGEIRFCHATSSGQFEASTSPGYSWRIIGAEHPATTTHDDIDKIERLAHWDYSDPPGANNFEATCLFNGKHYALGVGIFATAKDVVKKAFSDFTWMFVVFLDPGPPEEIRKWEKCLEAIWVETL